MKTIEDLMNRAKRAIERKEIIALDTALEKCQMFGNIKHTKMFQEWVAEAIANETKCYMHLVENNCETCNGKGLVTNEETGHPLICSACWGKKNLKGKYGRT